MVVVFFLYYTLVFLAIWFGEKKTKKLKIKITFNYLKIETVFFSTVEYHIDDFFFNNFHFFKFITKIYEFLFNFLGCCCCKCVLHRLLKRKNYLLLVKLLTFFVVFFLNYIITNLHDFFC
jgi:hypothetical protein